MSFPLGTDPVIVPINSGGSGGTNISIAPIGSIYSSNVIASITPSHAAIEGKMVQVYHEIDISDTSMQDQEAIDRLQSQMKVSLTEMLVKRLISEKVIEFTKTVEDSIDFRSKRVRYRARLFATPDDKVRLLRLNGKDSQ